jgi:hypothetical protein
VAQRVVVGRKIIPNFDNELNCVIAIASEKFPNSPHLFRAVLVDGRFGLAG